MGVAADLDLSTGGAMATGFVAGTISSFGFRFLGPLLVAHCHVQDICGVHNLHGMPGLISGIVGIFATIKSQSDHYGFKPNQPGIQAAGIFITLGFAIAGGIIIGILVKLVNPLRKLPAHLYYNDRSTWTTPSDYHAVM